MDNGAFYSGREQGSQFEARWWVHFDGLRCLGASDIGGSLAGAEEPRLGIQRGARARNRQVVIKQGEKLGWLRGCLQTRERGARKAGQA